MEAVPDAFGVYVRRWMGWAQAEVGFGQSKERNGGPDEPPLSMFCVVDASGSLRLTSSISHKAEACEGRGEQG